jgi:hypothetical protein
MLLLHTDNDDEYVNLLCRSTNTIRNTEPLLEASREVGLKVKTDTDTGNYMFMSHCQNAQQNYDIRTGKKRFQNLAKFKYLEMTINFK